MTQHVLTELSNTEAIRLTPNGLHSGMDITLQNIDSEAYVYVGAEGVSVNDYGYRIAPGSAFSLELPGPDSLYAISDKSNSLLAVLQTGLEQ